MFDATGSYQMVFLIFAGVVALGSVLVLAASPPQRRQAETLSSGNPSVKGVLRARVHASLLYTPMPIHVGQQC